MKTCSVCHQNLDNNKFRKKTAMCINCQNAYLSKYYKEHQEERRTYHQKHYLKNKWKKQEYQRLYYLKNKNKLLSINKTWRDSHKEKMASYLKAWNKLNPERSRELHRKCMAKVYNSENGHLYYCFGHQIYLSLLKNKTGRKWESIAGYSLKKLKTHLEKQFKDGMTWENYGKWHIDHIIPISAFNFETAEDIDFKKCWALKNLQPLWAKENLSKNNKLSKPFQPSLKLKAACGE